MKKINLTGISNPLSSVEMRLITGGKAKATCSICHCTDLNPQTQRVERDSDDMIWCWYDQDDLNFYHGYYCSRPEHNGMTCRPL